MTLKKIHIVEYIALINLQFPNAYQFVTERDEDMFVNLWFEGLKNYPKEICDVAVKNAILKAEFAPKIGTVVKELESLLRSQDKSDSELWEEFTQALRDIRGELTFASERYDTIIHEDTGLTTAGEARKRIAKVFDGLNPTLREYCGGLRGFMDLAEISESDLQFEKGRFLKQLPLLIERMKIKENTPLLLADTIKGLINNSKVKLIGATNVTTDH